MARNKADTFDVWGKPPPVLLRGLTRAQTVALRRYTEMVSSKTYRVAYDCGFVEGLCKVSMVATNEMKLQRERMLKSRKKHR